MGRLDVIEFTGLIGMEGIPKVNRLLEVEPKLRFGARETSETEGCVGCDRALALHDFVHARVGDTEPLSRLFLRDSERN